MIADLVSGIDIDFDRIQNPQDYYEIQSDGTTTHPIINRVYFPYKHELRIDEIDTADMHQFMMQSQENDWTIFTVKAPDNSPKEATISLLTVGNDVCQFVDLACMKYTDDVGKFAIVMQKRGNTPLPYFEVAFSGGAATKTVLHQNLLFIQMLKQLK